jgi:lipopolysaccharide export system protein LptA
VSTFLSRYGIPVILNFLLLAVAQAAENPATVKIIADSVEVNQKTLSSTYRGNVKLTQGAMQLSANKLQVFTKKGTLKTLKAEGNPAHFTAPLEDKSLATGEASVVNFDSGKGILHLSGNAKLTQMGNTIHNDRIEYNLKTGNLKAGGKLSKQRVEVILQPSTPSK